jgi:hypothetical protein
MRGTVAAESVVARPVVRERQSEADAGDEHCREMGEIERSSRVVHLLSGVLGRRLRWR